jgi:hypothetical protein
MPSTEPFVAVHVDAVPRGPDRGPGVGELKPVRRRLGIEAFGAHARVARHAGDLLVMPHDERAGGPDGTAGHELDGQDIDAPAGTLVFVRDPTVVRSAVANEADTAVLGIGAPPGEAYRVAPWEQRDIDAEQS